MVATVLSIELKHPRPIAAEPHYDAPLARPLNDETYREIGYSGLLMPDHMQKATGGDGDDVQAEQHVA